MNTLRKLGIGQRAVIKKVLASGELGRRIRDMGLVPGTEVAIDPAPCATSGAGS